MGKGGGSGPDYSAMIAQMNAGQEKSRASMQKFYDKQHQDFLASEKLKADQAAEAERLLTERADQEKLFNAYSTRVSQVNNATKAVDDIIKAEQAQARLSNVDYAISDEQRAERISNELAKLRTAADDQGIVDLATKYSDFAKSKGIDTNWSVTLGKAVTAPEDKQTHRAPGGGTFLTKGQDDEEASKPGKTLLGG